MRILSMTATFGKLEHQALTLKPGLNIIEAPNEWGKSTWCAFLTAMLYGIDTAQRTTQTALADKERYAPWSGQPMSGRLEIFWQGKNITIERSTKGRIPMGEFSAYETDTGLPLPELTAANCGQVLLGVERSVFLRAGFIRQTEMPVTQDDALRRRLNALVTTGDENHAGDRLAEKLKELKNRCRHNKTGALPQAEAQRAQLTEDLSKLTALRSQLQNITEKQQLLQVRLEALKNHQLALAYDNAQEGLYRLNMARTAREQAEANLRQLTEQAAVLPSREETARRLAQLRQLLSEKTTLEAQPAPETSAPPQVPEAFIGVAPEAAVQQARSDKAAYDKTLRSGLVLLPILSLLLCIAAVGAGIFLQAYIASLLLLLAAGLSAIYLYKTKQKKQGRKSLLSRYGTIAPDAWIAAAEAYQQQMTDHTQREATAKAVLQVRQEQLSALREKLALLTEGLSPEAAIEKWQSILSLYEARDKAKQEAEQAATREADLKAAVVSAAPPAQPDSLTLSGEETAAELAQVSAQLQQLQLQAGQCMGQIDALGQEEALRQQLAAVEKRIRKLTDLYEATVLALSHLEEAALQLQKRFAPQLTAKAKAMFSTLTGGRYDRLQLDQQLQLQAGAQNEDGLHAARWRSDGTVDQLYLALRLAVAEQLTPQAPLVLDDVLVRFDDTRHAAAMKLLQQLSQDKQVILFTCQTREAAYSPESIIEI